MEQLEPSYTAGGEGKMMQAIWTQFGLKKLNVDL